MGTVVFDFDSTIISCESLEKILERTQSRHQDIINEIQHITEDGIRGKISFAESLSRRLALAAPTKALAAGFGEEAEQWLTDGMKAFIEELQNKSIDVWMISGGIQESLLPLGKTLGIPESHIHGVRLVWTSDGQFKAINANDPWSRSKAEGARSLAKKWSSPKIAVGDSMSDYLLYDKGIVDHFILFTEHYRCKEVLEKGVHEAQNVQQLRQHVNDAFI